jgi:phosphoserine phosphatase
MSTTASHGDGPTLSELLAGQFAEGKSSAPDRDALLEQMAKALTQALAYVEGDLNSDLPWAELAGSKIVATARTALEAFQNMKEGRSNVTGE